MLLKQILEPVGLDVRVAEDGEKAVQLFRQWRPHFIWMDRRMPVMDGLTATKRIRELPGGKEVKIVALTSSVFTEQKDQALGAGSDDFVSKPYRPEEIFDCMARHLGIRYLFKETQAVLKGAEPQVVLVSSDLSALPEETLRELEQAVISGNDMRIDKALEAIQRHDETAATELGRLAVSYQYERILALLKPLKSPE